MPGSFGSFDKMRIDGRLIRVGAQLLAGCVAFCGAFFALCFRQVDHAEDAPHVHQHQTNIVSVMPQNICHNAQAKHHNGGGGHRTPTGPALHDAEAAPQQAHNGGKPGVEGIKYVEPLA